MIKFEEHEGLLFKMLDEPVPLTPDTELPVLVRMIQDDTMLGKANKRICLPDKLAKKIICSSSNLTDDGLFLDSIYAYRYEIIGTLVKEGSKEWALYQMMQGKWVYNPYLEKHKSDKIDTRCLHAYSKFGQDVVVKNILTGVESILGAANISHWTNYAEPTGWQLYVEPEPQHAKEPIADCENCKHVCTNSNIDHCHMYEPKPKPQYKVGDWVEFNDGVRIGQAIIMRTYDDLYVVRDYLYSMYEFVLNKEYITRKLSPSEIVVRIGCLSGTIAKSCDPNYFLMLHSRPATDCNHSMIRFSAIDKETRSLVESLLEAQEEE